MIPVTAMPERPSERVLQAIRTVVGPKGWIDDPAEKKPHEEEERKFYKDGWCAAVVCPKTTNEVADVVRICAEEKVPIVPQGGNTGLVGGGVPKGGIVLATKRLNQLRAIDPLNRTMTVEAGMILSNVQEEADKVEALFPLSLAAQGTCHIGGNLATNAGGIAVLRYGNARDLVLGLEVVLPDGRIWRGLRGLRKDNTGYDLKQLFIGSEGTLGVITAAVLKLFPKPRVRETALATTDSVDKAMELFNRIQTASGNSLTAFEFMDRLAVELCIKRVPGIRYPLKKWHPCYTLIELSSPLDKDPLRESLEIMLYDAQESGLVKEVVIAQNDTQAKALWSIRESIPESQKQEGASIKNDISVPLSQVAEFIKQATGAVKEAKPGIRVAAFGHLGDGNIHFNLIQPEGDDGQAFIKEWDRLFDDIVPNCAYELDGSFSAEHGVGAEGPMLRKCTVAYCTQCQRRREVKFRSPHGGGGKILTPQVSGEPGHPGRLVRPRGLATCTQCHLPRCNPGLLRTICQKNAQHFSQVSLHAVITRNKTAIIHANVAK